MYDTGQPSGKYRCVSERHENPCINIIGHPDDGRYEVDYEALVQGAKEYGKILELNNHSMDLDCSRENAIENDTVMLNYCKNIRFRS